MLVRYIKNSLLTKKINELDGSKLHEIMDLIHSLNLADLNHPFFQAENHTTEPCNQYELYLTYAYLSYLYMNKQLTYPGVEDNLSGFLSNIESREQDGSSLPFLDKDDFLQSYFIHIAFQSYPEKIKLFNANLSENQNLLQEYIDQLHKDFPMVPKDRLKQIIGSLTGINSIFFKVSATRGDDPLLHSTIRPGGYINVHSATPFNHTQIVPSISFIKALAQEFNPGHQVIMEPIFGQINIDTLYKDFHQCNYHPISLYSTWVKSNLVSVHNTEGSKLSIAMHDAYYHYMALCRFEPQGLDFITKELCPALKNLADTKKLAINSSALLSALFEKINDFATTPNSTEKESVWSYINSRITYRGNSEQEHYRHNRTIDLLVMAIHSLMPKQVFIKTHYQIDLNILLNQMVTRLSIKPWPESVISLSDLLNLVAEHSINDGLHESISAINFLLGKQIPITEELVLLLVQHSHRQLTLSLKNIVTQYGPVFFQQPITLIKEKINSYPNMEEPSIPEYIRTAYLLEQTLPLISKSVKKQIPQETINSIIEELVPIFLSRTDLTRTTAQPVRAYLEPFQPFLNSPSFFMFLVHFKKLNFCFSMKNWHNIINYGELVGYDFTSIVKNLSLVTSQNIHLLTKEFLDLILAPPRYTPSTTMPSSPDEMQKMHAQHAIEIFDFLATKILERMPTQINFFHEKPPYLQLTFQQLLYAINRENIPLETLAQLNEDIEFRLFSKKEEYSPIIELFCSKHVEYHIRCN